MKMNKSILLGVLLLGACANDPRGGAILGGAVGGATGAAVGHQVGGRSGAVVGGAIGGAAGAAIGGDVSQPNLPVRRAPEADSRNRGHDEGKNREHRGEGRDRGDHND